MEHYSTLKKNSDLHDTTRMNPEGIMQTEISLSEKHKSSWQKVALWLLPMMGLEEKIFKKLEKINSSGWLYTNVKVFNTIEL